MSYLTTYVLLFTYMLCLCAVLVSPDLSEYTFLDRLTDNTFTAHIQRIHNPVHSMCIRWLCASHGSSCKCYTISFVQMLRTEILGARKKATRCKYLLNTSFITEYKFYHACRQILVLNQRVKGGQNLYDRSVAVLRCSFRYSSLVRLMILKSVHDAFYEYATRRATEMDDFLLTH